MSKIKNMGTSTAKFGEGVIIDGLAGTDIHALIVTGSIFANSFTGSATRAVADQNGKTLYGGINYIDYGIFQNPTSSASIIYFPADDSLIEATFPTTVNFNIAIFPGQLEKVVIKSSLDLTNSGLTCSFHKGNNNASSYSSTPSTTRFANGQTSFSTYTFDFKNDQGALLNENDIYGFGLRLNNGFNDNGNFHFTFYVKYFP